MRIELYAPRSKDEMERIDCWRERRFLGFTADGATILQSRNSMGLRAIGDFVPRVTQDQLPRRITHPQPFIGVLLSQAGLSCVNDVRRSSAKHRC